MGLWKNPLLLKCLAQRKQCCSADPWGGHWGWVTGRTEQLSAEGLNAENSRFVGRGQTLCLGSIFVICSH